MVLHDDPLAVRQPVAEGKARAGLLHFPVHLPREGVGAGVDGEVTVHNGWLRVVRHERELGKASEELLCYKKKEGNNERNDGGSIDRKW